MKKKIVALLMTITMAASLVACGSSAGTTDTSSGSGSAATPATTEKQDVSLRMWGAEEDQTMLQEMIDSFIAEYSDYANITVELGVESEADTKDDILTDIEAAPDVFAMASDQIPELVKAGALQSIDSMDQALQAYAGKSVADVKSANSEGSVTAATYNDTLYAFPMTADNGFFLYYDSTIFTEEDVQTWDGLLAAAEAAGTKVGMTLNSGWYNASFFWGAGFNTGLNDDGTTVLDWNGTADYTGVQVTQAMLDIASNPAFFPVSDGDLTNTIASGSLGAVVSGPWDSTSVQTVYGDGYAACKLPTYTIGNDQVQQWAVLSCKVVGVNAMSKNVGWATLLADWITNEQNQIKRFEERELGPSNIVAASSDAVAANVALSALADQSAYGVIISVGGNFWNPTATFGENIAQGTLDRNDEAAIQAALDTLVEGATAPVQ